MKTNITNRKKARPDVGTDFNKERLGKNQKWTWIKSIQGENIGKYSNMNIDGFMKRIKRTKVKQIGYKIEDLEEKNRRLKKAVHYV